MLTTKKTSLHRLRKFTAFMMISFGCLAVFSLFLPAVTLKNGKTTLNGLGALLLGWLPLAGHTLDASLRPSLSESSGTVWLANVFVPISLFFQFFAPREFKPFAVLFSCTGVALALRAFGIIRHDLLHSGYYCWLSALTLFLAGTIGAVKEELST